MMSEGSRVYGKVSRTHRKGLLDQLFPLIACACFLLIFYFNI
jgi:hypothetical protein